MLNRRLLSLLLALCLVMIFSMGVRAKEKPAPKACPTIVFVHGLGGWGQGAWFDTFMPHWGMRAGSVRKALNRRGYEAYAVSMGPVSSTWDRACELYAHLVGGRVDYGEAHAKAHGHDRYGQKCKALLGNWSTEEPIALIGHSFGGAASRMFAQLCEEGSAAERDAGQREPSPLFTGELKGRVTAVVSLAAPHNGSTAAEAYLNEDGEGGADISGQMLSMARVGMVLPLFEKFYPFRLGQFGLRAWDFYRHPIRTWHAVDEFAQAKDSAGYDLTIDGAKEVNQGIKCQSGIYYFSYCAQATEADAAGNQVPKDLVWKMFQGTSAAMGKKRPAFTTPGGIRIDDSWLPNDGLVNVVSARYPFNEPHKAYDPRKIERGVWQVMPTIMNYDHVDFGGGFQVKGGPEGFWELYFGIAEMLEQLERE